MVTPPTGFHLDLYHLDAAAIAHQAGIDGHATFDLYTRRAPFKGAFMLAAGHGLAAEFIDAFRFSDEQLAWLKTIKNYDDDFLHALATFRFNGDILAVPEGQIVFPDEPILRVTGSFFETMLLEAGLLRMLGISTLIATKSARITLMAEGAGIADFAYRRAHEPFIATRSGYIGGTESTSFVEGARLFDIPATGTIPHAIVQAFPDELTAFRSIAATQPVYTLLLDTYDVDQGIDHAIQAAQEEAATGSGHVLSAVRIDSGDLAEWAKLVKSRLMAANMPAVKVLVSGDIDEYMVQELLAKDAPIDGFGVGGNLGVGLGNFDHGTTGGVIGAVYKLAWMEGGRDPGPRMKIAGGKSTWPGKKRIYRIGEFDHDLILLDGEPAPEGAVPMQQPWMAGGELVTPTLPVRDIREIAMANLQQLPEHLRELTVQQPYPVRWGEQITAMRDGIIRAHGGDPAQ